MTSESSELLTDMFVTITRQEYENSSVGRGNPGQILPRVMALGTIATPLGAKESNNEGKIHNSANSSREWIKNRICIDVSVDIFFPVREKNKPEDEYQAEVALAKRFCAQCSVRVECLDYAIKNKEEGIWGGMTEAEREVYKKLLKQANESP